MITDYTIAFNVVNTITRSSDTTEKILKELGYTKPTGYTLNREKYESTYNFGILTRKYNIQNDCGIWQIYGEDSNCDFGGTHYEPLLETVEGKLTDVIDYAVNLQGFWSWGGGGRIEKITITKPKKV